MTIVAKADHLNQNSTAGAITLVIAGFVHQKFWAYWVFEQNLGTIVIQSTLFLQEHENI